MGGGGNCVMLMVCLQAGLAQKLGQILMKCSVVHGTEMKEVCDACSLSVNRIGNKLRTNFH